MLDPSLKKRIPVVLLGVFFIALGARVAYWDVWETRGGRYGAPPVTVVLGSATRWTAVSLASFGIALLGVLWRRRWAVASWLASWLCFAVAINFVDLPTCERADKLTSVCR